MSLTERIKNRSMTWFTVFILCMTLIIISSRPVIATHDHEVDDFIFAGETYADALVELAPALSEVIETGDAYAIQEARLILGQLMDDFSTVKRHPCYDDFYVYAKASIDLTYIGLLYWGEDGANVGEPALRGAAILAKMAGNVVPVNGDICVNEVHDAQDF